MNSNHHDKQNLQLHIEEGSATGTAEPSPALAIGEGGAIDTVESPPRSGIGKGGAIDTVEPYPIYSRRILSKWGI
jgi:hypothetical protein